MPGAISSAPSWNCTRPWNSRPTIAVTSLGLERAAQIGVAHAAPGAERHLAVLQVIGRVREQIVVAGMVVMHVADHDVLHLRRDRRRSPASPSRGGGQELAPALLRHRLVEPGVEDQGAALADDRPDEIIERHRHVVRVAAEEILARHAIVVRIAHGVDLDKCRRSSRAPVNRWTSGCRSPAGSGGAARSGRPSARIRFMRAGDDDAAPGGKRGAAEPATVSAGIIRRKRCAMADWSAPATSKKLVAVAPGHST